MAQGIKVMIIGKGAREHAISQAYEQSTEVEGIIVSPGNDFIAYQREKQVLCDDSCSLTNPGSILALAEKYKPDLIDVAQDDALAAGTVDLLQQNGFSVFGPTKQAARIEWDKRWSREFMSKYELPHPNFHHFDEEPKAKKYVSEVYESNPEAILYVKAAGLCSGKGALKSGSLDKALSNIEKMSSFGESGKVFLIEEGLQGEEFSYYAMSDGKAYITFKSAQDNKPALTFDEGDQTGGMGAISPAIVTTPFTRNIEERFIARAINGMRNEGINYIGMLYLGGMVVKEQPVCIEYNSRWGDPECQAVLPSLKTDYLTLIKACLQGKLASINIEQDAKSRVCVVGASRGYPNDYSQVTGKSIHGLEGVLKMEGINLLGAGISIRDGKFYANGGRLFSIIASADNLPDAREKAYAAISHIHIEGNNLQFRPDIGWRDVERFFS